MTDAEHEEVPPSPRRRETRARLLEAAAEVFVEEGLQGASVEAVCTRAGFTRGAFYSNFSSKEELFLAALTREYQQRTEELEQRAAELTPMLRDRKGCFERAEVADYVSEFFAPTEPETAWFVLENEFLLLAMRDPSIAPGFADFLTRFKNGLASMVEGIVEAAGRRFTIPVERAMPILGGVFERALRISALSGRDAPEGIGELGDRIAELIFAITEEIGPGEAGNAQTDCTPPTDTATGDLEPPSWK